MDSRGTGKPHLWAKIIGIIVGALIVVPASVLTERDAGPAHWLTKQQLKLFGNYYYPKLNLVALMLMEAIVVFIPVFIIGMTVRLLTGRTVMDWIKRKPRNGRG